MAIGLYYGVYKPLKRRRHTYYSKFQFTCNFCKKKYKTLKDYDEHMKEKHDFHPQEIKAPELKVNRFENLFKKTKSLINKCDRLISKESYIAAVENWKQSIDYYNLAFDKAIASKKMDLYRLRNSIFDSYLKFLLIDPLITKGYFITFQDDKIILKQIYGLNIFLKKWLEINI